MSTRRRYVWLAVIAVAALAIFVTAGPPAPSPTPAGAMAFGVLGDAPYFVWEEIRYRQVLKDLAAHDLRAIVHVGDILYRPCSDERFRLSLDWFNALPPPVIYTPGDNEWADCWSPQTGQYVPLERLSRLRTMFFASPQSLGARRVPVKIQATEPGFETFVENVRWAHEGLLFATFHLIGSRNGTVPFPGRTQKDDEEVIRRTAAATAWLRAAFAEARATAATAVVIAFHANPNFEQPPGDPERERYEPFLTALEEEVEAFGKPALVTQGNDHIYIVDHPLVRRTTGRRLDNLTRLQVPGSPDVGWVKVVVTPGATVSFSFEERVVPRWKYW